MIERSPLKLNLVHGFWRSFSIRCPRAVSGRSRTSVAKAARDLAEKYRHRVVSSHTNGLQLLEKDEAVVSMEAKPQWQIYTTLRKQGVSPGYHWEMFHEDIACPGPTFRAQPLPRSPFALV